jgi:hypothetical protein
MKRLNQMVVALVALGLVGCRPASDKVPKASESTTPTAVGAAQSPTNDRSAAQQKLSGELNELDAKMANLKAQAQRAGDKAKAEWEAQRPQLEAQRDAAAKKLEELKQSSKEAWDQTRQKTEAAFTELEKGFKEAWNKLKE